MKTVHLLRGLPGSGKSTWAKGYVFGDPNAVYVSADAYHTVDGEYRFDRDKAVAAHRACLMEFLRAVMGGAAAVVVDNTNTSPFEVAPYYRLADLFGYEVLVGEFPCSVEDSVRQNVHGVPRETIEKMAARLSEPLPPFIKVIQRRVGGGR